VRQMSGGDVGKPSARIRPGFRLPGRDHGDLAKESRHRLGEVDATDDGARLKGVVREWVEHARSCDGENPALSPMATDVGHHADSTRARDLKQRPDPDTT